jgi:hypothetical protein
MRHARLGVGLLLLSGLLPRGGRAQSAVVEITSGAVLPLAPGATLEFQGVNGEASFLNAADNKLLVEYARDVPADVKVVTVTTPGGVTMCTVYVSSDPKKPTGCEAGGKARLTSGKGKDASPVRVRVRVPAGVHVKATTDQGDLKSSGITGNLDFYSRNGYVLVNDGGGPGTIHAGVGLLGKVDAVIAQVQHGPASRQVRLEAAGSGSVRVAMPLTVGASYSVVTERPAAIDRAFHVEKIAPPTLIGHLGPAGETQIRLDVDTGIAGQFVLLPAK